MLFKFDSHPAAGYYDGTGKFVTAGHKSPGVSQPRIVLADSTTQTGQSFPTVDRYNPIRDRLDEGSVVEDWIPRDASGLDDMFRLMYHRDAIAGTIVDLIAETIWSDYELVGISDPAIKKIYQDTMESLDVISTMQEITREFLVLGRNISSLIFDKKRGIIVDVTAHDPSFVKLTPIPVRGYDPKIDLIPSPNLRRFVESADPRDIDARKSLPQAFLEAVQRASGGTGSMFGSRTYQKYDRADGFGSSGWSGIPLDPVSTMFTARRVFNYDRVGTSMFTRLINFWALEKALIDSNVTSARRRTRSILHVKCGIDNVWEPSIAEMENIAGMFIQAEEDPVGAVVTTRTGVDASEIRAGADFYKWSDEWTLLTEGKLRALGANDALLTGDATYSNQETARMFFMERAAQLRTTLTQRVFYKKIFPLLARIHGFKKRTQAELSHGIRVTSDLPLQRDMFNVAIDPDQFDYGKDREKLTQRQALDLQDSELVTPSVQWSKELMYGVDDKKLEIYGTMEEKGIPVSLRNWAAAGNIDLDAAVSEMDKDAQLRRRIAEWKKSFDEESIDDEARLEFINSLRNLSKAKLQQVCGTLEDTGNLSSYLFWDERGNLGPLSIIEMQNVIKRIEPSSNTVLAFTTTEGVMRFLTSAFQSQLKANIAHYLLFTTGFTEAKPVLSSEAITIISTAIKNSLDKYSDHGKVYQLAQVATKELSLVASISIQSRVAADKKVDSIIANMTPKNNKKYRVDNIPSGSTNLYSGR